MAYEDKARDKKMYRYTVRFKRDDMALIEALAKRYGMQRATLIQHMALHQAELELKRMSGEERRQDFSLATVGRLAIGR